MKRIGMVAAVLALLAVAGYAAPIMQVDLTAGGSSVQAGWLSMDYHDQPTDPSVTASGVTAKVNTSRSIGGTTSGATGPLANMFGDFAILGQQTYNGYGTLVFSGLTPGASYDVKVWTWCGTDNGIGQLFPGTTMDYALLSDLMLVTENLGTFAMAGPAPTSDTDYLIAFTTNATAGGKIILRQGQYNNSGVLEPFYGWTGPLGAINGFQIEETPEEPPVIPEPATLLLVGTGAVGVFGVIRRRMLK